MASIVLHRKEKDIGLLISHAGVHSKFILIARSIPELPRRGFDWWSGMVQPAA